MPVKNRKKTGSRFKRGESGNPNGRPPGARNKITREFKAAVAAVFDAGGGEGWLLKWAKKNPGEFFTIAARLTPREITGGLDVNLPAPGRVMVVLPYNNRSPAPGETQEAFDARYAAGLPFVPKTGEV